MVILDRVSDCVLVILVGLGWIIMVIVMLLNVLVCSISVLLLLDFLVGVFSRVMVKFRLFVILVSVSVVFIVEVVIMLCL